MPVGFPTKVNYATGDVLSATNMNDLSGTVNLLESAQYAAGKNKLINGDCNINQRAFTSTTTTATFGFDRFKLEATGGTSTYSAQTFTAGTAPVSGYESKNFMRLVTSGQSAVGDFAGISQPIEDVRTFAGQTVTFSVYAKASSGTPNIGFCVEQAFGTGGSATVPTSATVQAITTSWARYSFTINVPSIAGKTIGTGALQLNTRVFTSAGTSISGAGYPAVGIQNVTIDLWGWQLEAGSTASAFQTATGTIQGELAACQRYYWRSSTQSTYATHGFGTGFSGSLVTIGVKVPVTMRIAPTVIDFSNLQVTDISTNISTSSITFTASTVTSNEYICVDAAVSGSTQFRPYFLRNNNNTSGYIGFSAEL
jgi:hypothetical protein